MLLLLDSLLQENVSMSASMTSRALLTARNFTKVPNRGKALAGWTRPSIEELGVPTEAWSKVNSANQTKFLTQLGIGLTVFGATCYQLKQIVFVREQCNSTPYHLMKNE